MSLLSRSRRTSTTLLLKRAMSIHLQIDQCSNFINTDPQSFFGVATPLKINGKIKTRPEDFKVDEILRIPLGSANLIDSNKSTSERSSISEPDMCTVFDFVDNKESLDQLSSMNSWATSFISSVNDTMTKGKLLSVLIDTIRGLSVDVISLPIKKELSKSDRRMFFAIMRKNFPYLSSTIEEGNFVFCPNEAFSLLLDCNVPPQKALSLLELTANSPLFSYLKSESDGYYSLSCIPQYDVAQKLHLVSERSLNRKEIIKIEQILSEHFVMLKFRNVNTSTGKCLEVFWNPNTLSRLVNKSDASCVSSTFYIGFRLHKHFLDHSLAIEVLSKELGIPHHSFSFCGIKDCRAVTSQHCVISLRSVPIVGPQSVKSMDIALKSQIQQIIRSLGRLSTPFYVHRKRNFEKMMDSISTDKIDENRDEDCCSSSDNLRRQSSLFVDQICVTNQILTKQSHWGNEFNILCRDISLNHGDDSIKDFSVEKILQERQQFLKDHGYPNFFGSQRMGVQPETSFPSGVYVGKAIVLNDFRAAVEGLIFGEPRQQAEQRLMSTESGKESVNLVGPDIARRMFLSNHPLNRVMHTFPPSVVAARNVIQSLMRNAHVLQARKSFGLRDIIDIEDPMLWKKVLHSVSYGHRNLMANSYQSWLWNRVIAYRMKTLGLLTPIAGDFVIDAPLEPSTGDNFNLVTKQSIRILDQKEIDAMTDEQRKEIMKSIVFPLFGSRIQIPNNIIGE